MCSYFYYEAKVLTFSLQTEVLTEHLVTASANKLYTELILKDTEGEKMVL